MSRWSSSASNTTSSAQRGRSESKLPGIRRPTLRSRRPFAASDGRGAAVGWRERATALAAALCRRTDWDLRTGRRWAGSGHGVGDNARVWAHRRCARVWTRHHSVCRGDRTSSGAHINPAVTVGFWSIGRFPSRDVIPYVVAQCLGAIGASGFLLWVLGPVASLGATVPTLPLAQSFAVEMGYSGLLAFVIMGVATDEKSPAAVAPLQSAQRYSPGPSSPGRSLAAASIPRDRSGRRSSAASGGRTGSIGPLPSSG